MTTGPQQKEQSRAGRGRANQGKDECKAGRGRMGHGRAGQGQAGHATTVSAAMQHLKYSALCWKSKAMLLTDLPFMRFPFTSALRISSLILRCFNAASLRDASHTAFTCTCFVCKLQILRTGKSGHGLERPVLWMITTKGSFTQQSQYL